MKLNTLTRLGAGVLLVGAVVSCGSDGPDKSGQADTGSKTTQPAAADNTAGGDAATEPVAFTASEFAFDPSAITLAPGSYTGTLTNDGAVQHDISFGDGEPFYAEPGETVDISFEVTDAGVSFKCTIEGHAAAGMTGEISTS